MLASQWTGRVGCGSSRLHALAVLAVTFALVVASRGGPLSAQNVDQEEIPEDMCILELNLPDGATVSVDGRDYGAKRRFEFRPLQSGKTYRSTIRVVLAGGNEQSRTVHIEGGRRVRLNLPRPSHAQPEVVLQTGHTGLLWRMCATISRDGRWAVTGHEFDRTAILWDLTRGTQLRTFPMNAEGILSVALSPDGRQMLTGLRNSTAVLWDTITGRRLRTFVGLRGHVESVVFSPDGRRLATGGGPVIMLWDAVTGNRIRSMEAPNGVWSVAFSPNGRYILTGGRDDTTILWDTATGQRLRTFEGHEGHVRCVAFSPDGDKILTGGADGKAIVWDAVDGMRLHVLRSPAHSTGYSFGNTPPSDPSSLSPGPVTSVAFSPDGRRVLTGAFFSGCAVLWDAATGKEVRIFRSGYSLIHAAFRTDGQVVVVVVLDGHDNVGAVINATAGKKLAAIERRAYDVQRVAYSPSGRNVLIGFSTSCDLWDLSTGGKTRTFRSDLFGVHDLTFSPDGQQVLVNCLRNVNLWDVATGRRIHTFRIGSNDANCRFVDFSRDGRRVLAITFGDIAPEKHPFGVVWDALSGEKLRTFEGRWFGRFVGNGENIITGAKEHTAIVWDTETGEKTRSIDLRGEGSSRPILHPSPIAFSADGQLGLAHWPWGDGQVALFDGTSGQRLRLLRAHLDGFRALCIAFSPDGRSAAVGSMGGAVISWDLASGKALRTFRGHTTDVNAVAFSPDGCTLLSGSGDGTARLWDVGTGEELIRLLGVADFGQAKAHQTGSLFSSLAQRFTDVSVVAGTQSDHEWLAMTPDGLFDGSAGGREKVMFRVGGGLNVVPVDRFFQDFYYPGLLAAIWRGERPLPRIELGHSLPPRVRIIGPQEGRTAESPRVTVQVETVDEGGGVRGPWLVHNGARVLVPGEAEREGQLIRRRFEIALIEGDNRLEFHAACADGSWESEPAVITFRYDKPLPKPELHLLAVGVNDYADDPLDLQYARDDAIAMAELFRQRGPALYPNVHVTSLLDQEATSPAVLGAIRDVARRARPQDTLVVFLAGHGTVAGGQYYFLPQEFRRQAEKLDEDVQSQGIWAGQIRDAMETVPALKRMLVFDTGQSGGPMGLTRTARDPFDFRGAIERLSRASGTYVIAAAAVSDEAKEVPELGHGVLSYTLLAGLHAAEGGPLQGQWIEPSSNDRVAHALEWFGFASTQVPQLTKRYFGREQDIQHSIAGMSFPVLPVPQSAEVPRVDAVLPLSPVIRAEPPRVEPGVGQSKFYLVAVGINRYTEEAMNLELARGDAEAMAELFRRRGGATYRETHTNLVLDEWATRAGIVEAIEKLAGLADPEDTLAVFLAGHGKMVGQRYYFIPHEFRRRSGELEEDIREQALPADVLADAIAKVPARKRILILDTCASGGALKLSRQGQDPFAFRGAIEKLGARQGVFTIAASGAGEEAQEIDQLGHGVLTYALLAGLRAVSPGGPLEGFAIQPTSPDGRVDVLEWFSFAAGHVPRLTKRHLGRRQDVHISGQGTSFAVLVVAEPYLRSVEGGS